MLLLYSGTPGSGKSLHCARTICNWCRDGWPVIANFSVDVSRYKKSKFRYVPNDELTPGFLRQFSRQWFETHKFGEDKILLIIDECQLLFNAREWNAYGRSEWLSFFSQHRHYGYKIILVAQFDRMIDRQVRSLLEYEYCHRKMANFGFGGKVLSLVLGGKTFGIVQRWYPLGERVGFELIHARKRLYNIYDSYDKSFKRKDGEGG